MRVDTRVLVGALAATQPQVGALGIGSGEAGGGVTQPDLTGGTCPGAGTAHHPMVVGCCTTCCCAGSQPMGVGEGMRVAYILVERLLTQRWVALARCVPA